MKRSGAPQRRTALKPGDKPLQRKTPMPPGKGLKRSDPHSAKPAIQNKPSKASRSGKSFPAAAVKLMKDRAGGDLCEIGIVCGGLAPAAQSAHRQGKGSGGVGAKNTVANGAGNGLRACLEDHLLVDGASGGQAFDLGFKVRHGVARPCEVPVKHARLGWVLLADEGSTRPAPEASYADGLLPVIRVPAWELMIQAGAFSQAMERFGHLNCPGWPAPREGVFRCGCGRTPFCLLVVEP